MSMWNSISIGSFQSQMCQKAIITRLLNNMNLFLNLWSLQQKIYTLINSRKRQFVG